MAVRHAVLVTAAGSSSRFNEGSCSSVKKEFLTIDGQSVLCRAIEPFLSLPGLCALAVTCREAEMASVEKQVKELLSRHKALAETLRVLFVPGGATRQESVNNGLKALESLEKSINIDYVSIHDGARPFVTSTLAKACLEAAVRTGGACPALSVTDTVVVRDKENLLSGALERSSLCTVQTPQVFALSGICQAHDKAASSGRSYTDDTAVFLDWGGKVELVPGDPSNRKITYSKDISMNRTFRTGTGWDIHRLAEGRRLVLGGTEIQSPKGCLGHSDGDALVHAVIDSLLGAASLGDIGMMFPDSDPRFKDISSLVLLDQVVALVKEKGFEIVNVDTTVILQSPKMGPYREAICLAMKDHLEGAVFNLKAKTAEHMMGELGTSDAVVCQAVCTLSC